MLEFRGDLFPAVSIPDAVAIYTDFIGKARETGDWPLPVIHTLRLARDGGLWPDRNGLARIEVWENLAALPPETRPGFFDIELETLGDGHEDWVKRFAGASIRTIASHHQFHREYDPVEYRDLRRGLLELEPDGIKMAVTCRSKEACLTLLDFARETAELHPLAGIFSMGAVGKPTRIAAPLLGCPLTYGYLGGREIAPGQWPAETLKRGLKQLHGLLDARRDVQGIWEGVQAWERGLAP